MDTSSEAKNAQIGLRISQIRDKIFNGNNRLFAAKICEKEQNLSGICNGKRSAGIEVVIRILSNMPNLNGTWLLTGQGEMLLSDRPSSVPAGEPTANPERRQGEAAEGQVAILRELLREKDERIETLTTENARLRMQLQQEREKASSSSELTSAARI